MTAKELLLKRAPTLTEEEAERALHALDAEPRATREETHEEPGSSGGATPRKKVGRLSFFAIGASGTPDVSERFDEYLGRAIDRRHPRS